jgi:HSP20 family protein
MNKIENKLSPFINNIDISNTINGGMAATKFEIEESPKEYLISVGIPTLSGEAFNVEVNNDQLIIYALLNQKPVIEVEPNTQPMLIPAFFRSLPLPNVVNREEIEARFEGGTLKIRVPIEKGLMNSSNKRIDIQLD